jgi:hypothetical protein
VISSDKLSVWKCLVFPGVAETETFFDPSKALMVDDLPTLGYPTSPTINFVGEGSRSFAKSIHQLHPLVS